MISEKLGSHHYSKMNKYINTDNFTECCEIIKDENIFIKDIEGGQSRLVTSEDFDIHIKNSNNKNISFLKIDKCIYNDTDEEKCDCAVADEELIFFIEIKELENFDSHGKRNKKRKKAKSQLIATINNFKEMFPEIDLLNVHPIIALTPKLDTGYVSLITIKDQNTIDEFIEKCGCPNIFEGNYIEFN